MGHCYLLASELANPCLHWAEGGGSHRIWGALQRLERCHIKGVSGTACKKPGGDCGQTEDVGRGDGDGRGCLPGLAEGCEGEEARQALGMHQFWTVRYPGRSQSSSRGDQGETYAVGGVDPLAESWDLTLLFCGTCLFSVSSLGTWLVGRAEPHLSPRPLVLWACPSVCQACAQTHLWFFH